MAVIRYRVFREVIRLFEIGKPLEVRPAWGQASKVRVGDTLIFNDRVIRRVRAIRRYSNLVAMLAAEDYRRIHPEIGSADELLQILRSIFRAEAEACGILVFELTEAES